MGLQRVLPLSISILILCVALLAATCQSGQQGGSGNDKTQEELLLSYRVGGGMDMYKDGDRYGHGIHIHFDGGYQLYRRLYRSQKDKRSTIQDREIGEGTLNKGRLKSLRSKVDSLNPSSLPKRLPDVDPRKVEIRGPAESVVLRVRSNSSKELIEIRANMGADKKYYPDVFLRLHRDLKQLIRHLDKEK